MQKQSVFMALLILTACQPVPVVNPSPRPTSTPAPTASPIPSPTASQSIRPNPLPVMSPSPDASAFPSPPPLAPRPDSRRLLDPKDNTILADFRDTGPSQYVSTLNGLVFNDFNDGLIYWVDAGTRSLKASVIRDFAFGAPQRLGEANPEGQLRIKAGLDAQGNGLIAWNPFPSFDSGVYERAPSLYYSILTQFQLGKSEVRENTATYTLHDLTYSSPDMGSMLVSNVRMRTSQDPLVPTGQTPIERVPLVQGEPKVSERTLVMNMKAYFASSEPIKAANLNSQGNGLVIHANPQAGGSIVYTRIENFQATGDSKDLPELNNARTDDIKLSLVNGNGYLRWTEGNLMPVVNFEPRPERKIRLSHSDEELMGRARGDISLDANGTGLLAWLESLKQTGQARVYVKKIQNFVEVGLPYTMTWPDSSTLVQNIKISVNSQGKGYLSGMSLICTSGNPCDARLGRQIWVRRIEDFVP